jgi:hypothetical protein
MWKDNAQPDRPQTTIRRIRIACRISKATNTHSECLILIAFPQQKWLNERALKLRLYLFRLPCLTINCKQITSLCTICIYIPHSYRSLIDSARYILILIMKLLVHLN